MRFQLFAARSALALLALALMVAATALASVRLQLMSFSDGLLLMAGAALLAFLALLTALAWAVRALARNRGEGKRMGFIALAGSVLFLLPPLHAVSESLTAPPINDATTDPEDPPQFVTLARARKPGMNPPAYDGSRQIHFRGDTNTVNFMLHTYYAAMTRPRGMLLMTKSKLFWRAFETAKKLGWRIADYSEKEGRIEAIDTSFWFGQKADIVIRVREAGALGARADIRAQSETGPRDFGSNIERLNDFLNAL